jgi:uncharacterized membrane protein
VTHAARARWIAALGALLVASGALPWVLALARVQRLDLWIVFQSLCHQRPERTLLLFGEPMLVCSRCAGLYAGVALGALLPLPSRWLAHGRALVLGALALVLLDVIPQDLGLHPPWHASRLTTGLLLGWTASAFMFTTLRAESKALRSAASGPAGARSGANEIVSSPEGPG